MLSLAPEGGGSQGKESESERKKDAPASVKVHLELFGSAWTTFLNFKLERCSQSYEYGVRDRGAEVSVTVLEPTRGGVAVS